MVDDKWALRKMNILEAYDQVKVEAKRDNNTKFISSPRVGQIIQQTRDKEA